MRYFLNLLGARDDDSALASDIDEETTCYEDDARSQRNDTTVIPRPRGSGAGVTEHYCLGPPFDGLELHILANLPVSILCTNLSLFSSALHMTARGFQALLDWLCLLHLCLRIRIWPQGHIAYLTNPPLLQSHGAHQRRLYSCASHRKPGPS